MRKSTCCQVVVIFTRPVPAHHFLGVLLRMSTISISVLPIPRRTPGAPRSSPLPITVLPIPSPSVLPASGPIIPYHALRLLLLPGFAITPLVLQHEEVQDSGQYAIAPPEYPPLRRPHPKGNTWDIPGSPIEQ